MSVPIEYGNAVSKMSMGSSSSSSSSSCKISMLWNWYTIDTCFIARSWKNDTKGKFAGSCIGCFALVVAAQWLHRCGRQFDIELTKRHRIKQLVQTHSTAGTYESTSSLEEPVLNEYKALSTEADVKTTFYAIWATLKHDWFLNFTSNAQRLNDASKLELFFNECNCQQTSPIYPTMSDHIARSLLFTVQWGLSYIIMLLFMYYNGYIIISCLIGAFIGRILFNYEKLSGSPGSQLVDIAHDREEDDRKCCM